MSNLIFQDSTYTDTIETPAVNQPVDTGKSASVSAPLPVIEDTATSAIKRGREDQLILTSETEKKSVNLENSFSTDTNFFNDSLSVIKQTKDYNFIKEIDESDNSLYHPKGMVWYTEDGSDRVYKDLEILSRVKKSQNNLWIIGISLGILMILISMRLYFSKFISAVINTTINFQLSEKMLREKNIITRRAFALMNLVYILSISLFFFFIHQVLGLDVISKPELTGYLLIVLAITAFVMTKYLLIYLFSYIFQVQHVINEYIHNIYLNNKNIGLFLLPIAISMAFVLPEFMKIIMYIGISFILVFLIFRLLRSIQIIIKHRIFLFYSILYLCSLEILPLLFGFKLLKLL